jgi:hypothetical protein
VIGWISWNKMKIRKHKTYGHRWRLFCEKYVLIHLRPFDLSQVYITTLSGFRIYSVEWIRW